MQLRENALGSTAKHEKIYNSRQFIDSFLPDDPSYKEGIEIIGKGYINLRMNNYKLVQNTTPQMDIQASLKEKINFRLGDVFRYDDGYWLCVESYNRHDIERTGRVEECNYYLQWQNPKTLELHGRWCSVRDPYSLAIDERSKVVVTGNAKYKIKLPHDEETELFHADKRFLVDMANDQPIPYAIIKYDATTYRYAARKEGFLVITLKESQVEHDDDYGLMIANYKKPSTLAASSIGAVTVTYSGEPCVKTGGGKKVFKVAFFDNNGERVWTVKPVWELILPEGLQGKVSVVYESDDEIHLKAAADAPIGSVFELRASADDAVFGVYEKRIEVKVGGIL
jgi:hypothetical protein